MPRAFALTASLAALAVAPASAGADAVDPGVHVDPGSPAGKEYALPLDQARREARGGVDHGTTSGGSRKRGGSELFGEGIEKKGGGGPSAKRGAGSQAKRSAGRRANGKPSTPARLTVPAGAAPGGSTALTDVGIALAVLMAAAALGLGLRRVLR